MSEILTESFCERCGTRYTFESARPKIRLKGVKVLSRGLKNFVLSDDTTMDEAMAAARSETDREGTAHQLDAFHKTFSFCMSCRQYTCPNCWNDVEARCQSCAPLASLEIAPTGLRGFMTLADATVAEPATNGANGHSHEPIAPDEPAAIEAEPIGLEAEPAAAEPEWASAVAEVVGLAAESDAPAAESEAPAAQAVATDFVADDVAAEPGAKATSQTAGLLSRFRPGQSLDAELAAFERQRSGAANEIGVPEPDGSETPAFPEASSAAEEPIAAVAEPEAEAAAAIQVEPEPAAPSAADVVEQPTWRITAPDAEPPAVGLPSLDETPVPLRSNGAPAEPAKPNWPTRPEWPAQQASQGLPFLGRPVQPEGGVESLWAASNRELVSTPPAPGRSTGIQPCISCGLSLSATARFCRRCGTLQGG